MIDYIVKNWQSIAEAIIAIVGAASIIIKMTPTLKDDSIWLPIVKFLGKFVALDKYGPAEVKRPS